MHQALAERVQFKPVICPVDGATTAVNSTTVDMAGYKGVCFMVVAAAITGTIDAKVQQCSQADDAGTDAADITDAAITQIGATEDGRMAIIDVKPGSWAVATPHLRVVVTPTGGTTNLIGAVAARYGKDGVLPVTQDATMAELVKV